MQAASAINKGLVTTDTAAQHSELVTAQQRLTAALIAPAISREKDWADPVDVALKQLHELLQTHRASAESDSGLLVELGKSLKSSEKLDKLRLQHARLIDNCNNLITEVGLCQTGADIDINELRARLSALITALQLHQALEADLIFQAFRRDISNQEI